MTIFDRVPERIIVGRLAYGNPVRRKPVASPVEGGQMFRLERAQPYYRVGVLVKAVPQFRALTMFSPTTKNTLLPTVGVTPAQVNYPVKVK